MPEFVPAIVTIDPSVEAAIVRTLSCAGITRLAMTATDATADIRARLRLRPSWPARNLRPVPISNSAPRMETMSTPQRSQPGIPLIEAVRMNCHAPVSAQARASRSMAP